MSDTVLLTIGTPIFAITVWATLAVGYARFGRWYDRDVASEYERRRRHAGSTQEVRTEDLPHDDLPKVRDAADASA